MSVDISSNDGETVVQDPTRRDYLKRVGLASGSVVAIGAGGSQVAPRFSPVGRAEALDLVDAGKIGLVTAVSAPAGIAYATWQFLGDNDLDPEDVIEDQIYETAASVADGREEFVAQMDAEYLGPDDPESTPYGNAAWQEIRATVARETTNGLSLSEVQSAAHTALDEQTTRSLVNIVERLNTLFNALVQQIVVDIENDVGSLYYENTDPTYIDAEDALGAEAEPLEVGESEEYQGSALFEIDVDTPIPADELEGRDEPLKHVFVGVDSSYGFVSPFVDADTWINFNPDNPVAVSGGLMAEGSSGTQEIYDPNRYGEILNVIADAYSSIQSELDGYVENIYDGIQQGAIDPSDILSAQDIVDQFADSNEQSRVAAELLAIGADVPDSAGYQATISHPDLSADELTGMLYPQFDGDAKNISAGMTLNPSDYRLAYFGFESALEDSDEWITETLSGEEPLEILEIDGIEGDPVEVPESYSGGSADSNSRVVIWDEDSGGDPPDQLANPDEYSGWNVVITGADNEHVGRLRDVQQSGTEYYLEPTVLAADEAVEAVEIVPGAGYSQPVTHVADPTVIESEKTIERLENLRETVDDLEDALGDDSSVSLPGVGDADDFLGFGDLGWLTDNIAGIPVWGWVVGVAGFLSVTGDS